MILQLFRRTPQAASITSLYGTIVAQGRAPAFYSSWGVPDTVDGRFEMILLHLLLLLRRLEKENEPTRRLGQGVFDAFCRDMDASLREMGVGDLAVPRRMREIGEAFYGRQAAYRTALAAATNGPLAEAIARNVFGTTSPTPAAERLADYVQFAGRELAGQPSTELLQGTVRFPDPERLPVAALTTQGIEGWRIG